MEQRAYDGANRADLRRALEEFGLSPNKKLGQNFLCDGHACDEIVRAAGLLSEKAVLEIGPGPGALTVRLVRAAKRVTALELDAALPELMAALDVLAARKTPPADRQELKRVLSRLPEALDYDAAARTLALADPRWNSQPALYAALRLSREPYLPAQLAVTSAELTAAHIRGGRQAWVLRGLLDAVIAAPQINFPEALLALAKTLAGQA